MLLLNLIQKYVNVNGTRYIVEKLTTSHIYLRSVVVSSTGKRIVVTRMSYTPGDQDFTIPGLIRRQFSFRVCFAMTINKSQGQTVLGRLGIDLVDHCFAHGQLYVTLSRSTDPINVYIVTGR